MSENRCPNCGKKLDLIGGRNRMKGTTPSQEGNPELTEFEVGYYRCHSCELQKKHNLFRFDKYGQLIEMKKEKV